MPPVPAVVTDKVSVWPAHTVASVGTFAITGPTKLSTTVQLIVLPAAVVHPVPVDVLLDSIVLVPVTAAKLGKLVLHDENVDPLLVE